MTISPTSGGPVVRRGVALVGVAANARFAGVAVTIDGEPVHWRVARWRRGRDGPSSAVASSLLDAVLRRFHPVAVVVLIEDTTDGRLARARSLLKETLRPVLVSVALPTIEVTKTALARDLGLSRSTSVALRRELLRRTPLPRLHERRVADARETERYWECAVLASGATRVPLRHAATVHA